MFYFNTPQKGFTTIELLTALAIGSMSASFIIETYQEAEKEAKHIQEYQHQRDLNLCAFRKFKGCENV